MLEDMTGSHWKQYSDLAFVSLTSVLKSLCKLYLPVFSETKTIISLSAPPTFIQNLFLKYTTQDTENLMCKKDDQYGL